MLSPISIGSEPTMGEVESVYRDKSKLFVFLADYAFAILIPISLVLLAGVNFVFINNAPPTPRLFVMPVIVGLVLGGLIQLLIRQKHLLTTLNTDLMIVQERLSTQTEKTLSANKELRATQGAAILAVGAVHDIRNILIPLTMGASLIEPKNSDEAETLEAMQQSASQGASLCNTILRATQPKSDLKRHDVEALISDLFHRIRSLLPGSIELKITLDTAHIYTNKNDLLQVLHNLSLNSYQACKDNAAITAEGSTKQDHYRLTARDNGPGLPAHVLDTMARPRLSIVNGEPHGIGMAIVKELTRRNQITVAIDSTPDGTAFHLGIPLKSL